LILHDAATTEQRNRRAFDTQTVAKGVERKLVHDARIDRVRNGPHEVLEYRDGPRGWRGVHRHST
jgi:hypothetical protein